MFSTSGWICFILSASFFFLNCCLLTCAVDADVSSSSSGTSSNVGSGLRIDIIRKRSIQVNAVEVDENTLLDHLEDHERELIFGKAKTKREVRLVHLRQRTDAAIPTTIATTTRTTKAAVEAAAAAAAWEAPKQKQNQQQQQKHQRVKRSDITAAPTQSGAQPTQEVSIQIQDDDADSVNLHLRRAPKLIDEAFIFIGRYANTTRLIGDSHTFAQRYANCFYSNDNSALDLCDDGLNVRGILHHNATDFFIHPLPRRFGNSSHVIVAAVDDRQASYHDIVASKSLFKSEAEKLDPNLQFEPDEEGFNEVERPIGHPILHERLEAHPQRQSQSTVNEHHQKITLPTSHDRSSYQPRYHFDQQSQTHHRQHHLLHLSSENHRNQQHGNGKRDGGRDHQQRIHRHRRHIQSDSQWSSPRVLDIETAVFVDSDLFNHMAKNFPDDTEAHLFRFVLAMINGVQHLYHDPSLRHRVNFVLKRLEILYNERADLRRSSDIDTYLSNFCMWQRSFNPTSDTDAAHYDHAVILTGLDLYVMGKNGKVISQVVGLAPVAGMCSPTSSCTINEGKHFESVFVVAHEIGHNLGMRHDTKENSCDPTLYIMSPTLGSGKITWSKCSRSYLDLFLNSHQAKCLQNRGQVARDLDHSAGGLPGERFDASKQCMLKYGKGTVQARSQLISDVCRDLHCQRDRYTWTSHPALEGTECGDNMWCRSGVCKSKPSTSETHAAPKQLQNTGKFGYDKASFLESSKMGHLLHEYNYNKSPLWEDWGKASECDSGCLYGPSKRLREGSTGLKTYTRRCLDHQRMCPGHDRKFESCIAKQCYSIDITTIADFARREVCEKAQKFDPELTGEGLQISGKIEESCKVFCKTKSNGTKSRRATFPDGTTCHSTEYHFQDTAYCIAGRCERFTCDNSTNNYFKIDPIFCQYRKPGSTQAPAPPAFENRRWNDNKELHITYNRYADRGTRAPTTTRSKYENEVVSRNYHGIRHYQNEVYKRKSDPWNKYNYHLNEQNSKSAAVTPHLQHPHPQSSQSTPSSPSPLSAAAPVAASLVRVPIESDWIVKSGCHSSCMAKSRGIQVVSSRRTGAKNIQLCTHTVKPCERLQTATEYADNTCARYKLKVRGLSGHGTQIAASIDEPDRSCRVGCQDEQITYRFYLVNGKYGHFPLGTKCSNTEERYCVNGKCLEFGPDKIPLQESHISLALFRSRRSLASPAPRRIKRSYLYYEPVNITETITQEFINNIIDGITEEGKISEEESASDTANIDLNQPIHVTTEDELIPK